MSDQHTPPYGELEMEQLTCQMKALIRAKWPEKFNVKRADLQVMVSNRNPVSRNEAREFNRKARRDQLKTSRCQANIVPFPLAKKRGAKVRTGPRARIMAFPGAIHPDELDERYEFIKRQAHKWETTDADGKEPVNWSMRRICEGFRIADGRPPLTKMEMRKVILEGRARIETRNRIKTYLERRGVDLDGIRDPEDALLALFGFVGDNT